MSFLKRPAKVETHEPQVGDIFFQKVFSQLNSHSGIHFDEQLIVIGVSPDNEMYTVLGFLGKYSVEDGQPKLSGLSVIATQYGKDSLAQALNSSVDDGFDQREHYLGHLDGFVCPERLEDLARSLVATNVNFTEYKDVVNQAKYSLN